jgi:hypothetical protein
LIDCMSTNCFPFRLLFSFRLLLRPMNTATVFKHLAEEEAGEEEEEEEEEDCKRLSGMNTAALAKHRYSSKSFLVSIQ